MMSTFVDPLENMLFLRILEQNTTTIQLVMHDILLLAVLYKITSEKLGGLMTSEK